MSLSSFIPKPHTPFQWLAMDDERILQDKQQFLKSHLRKMRSVEIKEHPVRHSVLEAVFSRGDRRLAGVLARAWEAGARLDSWRDHFRFPVWEEAFEKEGVDYQTYLGQLETQAVLPWDHVQTGMKKSFLLKELDKALREENTPSCLELKCGQCQGCDFWPDIDKEFSQTPDVRTQKKPFLGRTTDIVSRYHAFYAKTGPARFISHNDLMNVLQRAFRRAGVAAVYREGFHPKMHMSFVPALPLGMEGKDESFEFKSPSDMAELDFLSVLNRNVPPGILFKALKKVDPEAPSLTNRILSLVYSLDMTDEKIQEALGAAAREKQDLWAVAQLRVEEYWKNRSDWVEDIHLDDKSRRLIIRLRFTPQKSIRPQDIVTRMFGLREAVSMMTRERIVFAAPRPQEPGRQALEIDRPS
jgi:radical SAM-linked protein